MWQKVHLDPALKGKETKKRKGENKGKRSKTRKKRKEIEEREEKRNKKETSLIFKKKFIEFSVKIVYNRYH